MAERYLEWRCNSRGNNRLKGGKGRCGQPKTRKISLTASVGERSCDSPATRITRKIQKARRRATEIWAKMRAKRSEEISKESGNLETVAASQEVHQRKQGPVRASVQERDSERRRHSVVPEPDAGNDQKHRPEKRIQSWIERLKRVLNRRSYEDNKNKKSSISQDWKALTDFVKKGRAPPISAVLIPQRDEESEGIEALNRKHAVETSDLLQHIEQQWGPIFNRKKRSGLWRLFGEVQRSR